MKKKTLLVGALSCLCVGTVFSTYHPPKAGATMNDMDTPLVSPMFAPDLFKPDFAHDKVGAEKWAKEHYKKWSESLPSGQIKSLNELKTPDNPENYDINRELKFTGGDINRLPSDVPALKDQLKLDIDRIDKALSHKEGKTPNKMYVYKDMKLPDLNNMKDEDLIDPTHPYKIDTGKLKEFKNNFDYGILSDYLIVNLSEREGGNNGILKWKIELPASTNAGHLDEDRLVLQRNTGLEINGVTIINQKGKEYIRINAKLVTRDKIDERIKRTQSDLNKSWNEALGLPESTEFIKFEVNDRYASSVSEGARSMVHEMASNVSNDLIKNVASYMVEKKGGFIFTDIGLRHVPEAYAPKPPVMYTLDKFDNMKGIYNPFNRTIIMQGPSAFKEGYYGMNTDILTHEFGHVVDHYLGHFIYEGITISSLKEFGDIVDIEGNNLTEYGQESKLEFFAEAFMMMHSSNPEIRAKVEQNAPQTFKFISDRIKDIGSTPSTVLVSK
ncbi:hypothetical protein BK704_10985 [[Bacillus thuringiensis] serovar konkukian]|nr:ADP-ribosyltransferase [Bacillus thuringiensis]MED1305304.1 ADP-ribosyltransferase [Bacillus pacificus]OUB12162.1 hypothetical protein BK704_10985 [[Bacillus thuringiensis] serovar konkukian]